MCWRPGGQISIKVLNYPETLCERGIWKTQIRFLFRSHLWSISLYMEILKKPKEVWCLQYFGKVSLWSFGQSVQMPASSSVMTLQHSCAVQSRDSLLRRPRGQATCWRTDQAALGDHSVLTLGQKSFGSAWLWVSVLFAAESQDVNKPSPHSFALWKQNQTTELWCTPSAICLVYSSGNYICFSFTRAQQEPK